MAIFERSNLLSTDELHKMVGDVIIEIADEKELDPRTSEDVAEKLGFTEFAPTTKDGQIKTKYGLTGAPLVGEFDEFVISNKKYGPATGYDVVRTFVGSGMSSEAKAWGDLIGKSEIPKALAEDLKKALNEASDSAIEIKIKQNEFITKVFTKGFSISSENGPGAPTYDGKPLFSDEHIRGGLPVGHADRVYSNIVDDGAGNHAPLTYDSLKKAVKMSREMKDGRGVRLKRPTSGVYDLIVSPELEETALEILNDGNAFSAFNYSGDEATNGNFTNIFVARDGFKVKLVVLETMNQPDSEDETETIGTDTMWFLVNKDMAKMRKAFLNIKFRELIINLFKKDDNNATFLTLEKFFGAKAIYPEVIVGSKGDSSAI